MSRFISISSLLLGLFLSLSGFAQSGPNGTNVSHTIAVEIPSVSLVNVVGNAQVNLSFSKTLEAGNAIGSVVSDSSFWLNYSFIKGSGSRPYNHVYAKIINGAIPSGTHLSVYAKPYEGIGLGEFGTPTGEVSLNQTEVRVIENISSCYTGKGFGNGHQLVYQLKLLPNAYHMLDFEESQQLSVLYTISD